MAKNPALTARVDPAIVARVEACAAAHNERGEPGAPQLDRGSVVRLLILRSLPAMEAELGITPPSPVKKSTPKKKSPR